MFFFGETSTASCRRCDGFFAIAFSESVVYQALNKSNERHRQNNKTYKNGSISGTDLFNHVVTSSCTGP